MRVLAQDAIRQNNYFFLLFYNVIILILQVSRNRALFMSL